MKDLKIDPELRDLLPPLTDEEYKNLEKNITANGFDKNFPIMAWNGFIADGHNRYSICKKHNIEYVVGNLAYETKDEVMEWMLDIQLGRRNLSPIQRIVVAEKYRPIYEKQAKENLKQATGGDRRSDEFKNQGLVNLPKVENKINTSEKLANIAGVSEKTYRMGSKVLNSDDEELKQEVLSGEKSISAAYKDLTTKKTDSELENNIPKDSSINNIQNNKSEIDDDVRKICEDLKVPRTPEYLASIWDYKLNIIDCMNADFDSFYTAFVSTLSDMDGKVTSLQLDECIKNAEKMITKMENVLIEAKKIIKLKVEE